MKAKIDSFVGPLMEHLRAEVDVLLGLHYLDSEELRKTIERTDAMAKRSGELRVVMVCPYTPLFPLFHLTFSFLSSFLSSSRFNSMPKWNSWTVEADGRLRLVQDSSPHARKLRHDVFSVPLYAVRHDLRHQVLVWGRKWGLEVQRM